MLEVIVGAVSFLSAILIIILCSRFFPKQMASWLIDTKESPLKETEEFLSKIREAVVDQVLNKQPRLFDAIAKQRMILANQEREPVAIFLNPEIFKELLRNSLNNEHLDEVDSLYEAMHELDMPIGYLGELPMYVTELLKNAPVFIAGGINWEI